MKKTLSRRVGHILAIVLATLALAASTLPAAGAEGGEAQPAHDTGDGPSLPPFVTVTGQEGRWTTFEAPIARVYGNGQTADGFIAITTGDLTAVCSNTPPPLGQGRFRQKQDGTWVVRSARGGLWQSVAIYRTDLNVFAFFDQQCPLFAAGDPAFAQPFATGWVLLRDKAWDQPEPFPMGQNGRYKNSIRGWAWTEDGTKYRVRALADYEVSPEGELTFFRDFLKVRPYRHD